MRKWGIVISVFYAAIVGFLLVPAFFLIGGTTDPLWRTFATGIFLVLQAWLSWILIGSVLVGQALLLFLSVDTSQKKLKPRTHIAISVAVSSMLFGLLTLAVIFCVGIAARGDKFGAGYLDTSAKFVGGWVVLWLIWGVVFYLHFRNATQVTTRAISWLLKGSVLELLIAVPCHVWVRRRDECCAPFFTSFGIVTGIAVMLLCFGPSVLFLFKKRLDAYSAHKSA
ncbi:MAG: hypothetical protein ABSA85_01065 [Terracidiphilus sp.]|jgi:hypothetical protein